MTLEVSENIALSKVILGTAQFGLDYGVSSNGHKPSVHTSHGILDAARLAKIQTLDTARAYGDSETVIGEYSKSQFVIQTKVGAPPAIDSEWPRWLEHNVSDSEERLGSHKLRALFFHDTKDLIKSGNSVIRRGIDEFSRWRPEIELGASLYDPSEWFKLKLIDEISVYQVPFNIFDRRFEDSGTINEMIEMGKKVQARSIFLQGLLLMNLEKVPDFFSPWLSVLGEFHDFCESAQSNPLGVAANFVLGNPNFEGVVVGFHSAKHVVELQVETSYPKNLNTGYPVFGKLDVDFLDPRQWNNS
jgi:aryl-alcohol dehydrogenase-like predicted oxidoreductase